MDGQREFENAMAVEGYVVPVDVYPNGSIADEDGNYFR